MTRGLVRVLDPRFIAHQMTFPTAAEPVQLPDKRQGVQYHGAFRR